MEKIRKILFLILLLFIIVVLIGFIQKTRPYTEEFSDKFYYAYEQNAIFGKGALIDVPPNIIVYSFDKKNVLIKQKPKYNKDEMYDYNESYLYINGLNINYYWIIDLDKNIVKGPLSYDEFIKKSKEENVNQQLLDKFLN